MKAGSDKTQQLRCSSQVVMELFLLPVCIIQGPLLAAVGLVMKAA